MKEDITKFVSKPECYFVLVTLLYSLRVSASSSFLLCNTVPINARAFIELVLCLSSNAASEFE